MVGIVCYLGRGPQGWLLLGLGTRLVCSPVVVFWHSLLTASVMSSDQLCFHICFADIRRFAISDASWLGDFCIDTQKLLFFHRKTACRPKALGGAGLLSSCALFLLRTALALSKRAPAFLQNPFEKTFRWTRPLQWSRACGVGGALLVCFWACR